MPWVTGDAAAQSLHARGGEKGRAMGWSSTLQPLCESSRAQALTDKAYTSTQAPRKARGNRHLSRCLPGRLPLASRRSARSADSG